MSHLTSEDYTKNLLLAISIIAEQRDKKNQFNKTLLCTIVSCEDADKGIYKVKYQDGYWDAYSTNLDTKYDENTSVYVLVPNGDMSNSKLILGSSDNKLSLYTTLPTENIYNVSNLNIIKDVSFNLCSYWQDKEIETIFTVNSLVFKELKKYDLLSLSCKVQTKIPKEQQRDGKYGFKVYLKFNVNGLEKEIPYIFSSTSMLGDVYQFTSIVNQEKNDYEFDSTNFIGISKITGFVEDFPKQEEDKEFDIFITDIKISGSELTKETTDISYLDVTSPQDFYFSSDKDVEVNAYIYTKRSRKGGGKVGTGLLKYPIYWFKRNPEITKESETYKAIVGEGWECLNLRPTQRRRIQFKKLDVVSYRERYICVATLLGIKPKEFYIINPDGYAVSLETVNSKISDNTFYKSLGQLEVRLKCERGGSQVSDGLTYIWETLDLNNNRVKLEEKTDSIIIKASDITINKSKKYTGYVYGPGNVLYGFDEITIYNKNEIPNFGYRLTLTNGDQSFVYNNEGLAPNSIFFDNPQLIRPLGFSFVNKDGEDITPDDIDWTPPPVNTLLRDVIISEDERELNFNIREFFDSTCISNQIELKVTYNYIEYFVKTNFTFAKQGSLNSVSDRVYVCVLPNTETPLTTWPIVYYDENGIGTPNWELPEEGAPWFKLRVWNKDEDLTAYEVKWSVVGLESLEGSWFKGKLVEGTLVEQPGIFSFEKDDDNQIPYLIVRAKVQYGGVEYFGTLPVAAARSQETQIIITGGTPHVTYSSLGKNPSYSSLPLVISNYSGNYYWVPLNCCFKFYGREYNEETDTYVEDSKLKEEFIEKENFNGLLFYNDEFDGFFTGNMILGDDIYIPIHCYLDYYNSSRLSEWNGNYIDLGNKQVSVLPLSEEGDKTVEQTETNLGKIYAVQIGSGSKNANGQFSGIIYGLSVLLGVTRKGLLGYHDGLRTIFLNEENGRAEFGRKGAGQIIIDPSTDVAQLFSGNYQEAQEEVVDDEGNVIKLAVDGAGLLIDLTTPLIKFGSGQFSVDSDGNLTANSGTIANWVITDEDIRNSEELFLEDGSRNPNFVKLSPDELRLGNTLIEDDGAISGSGPEGHWYINEKGSAYFSNLTLEDGKITTSAGDIVPINNYIDDAVAEAVEDLDISLLDLQLSRLIMVINLDTGNFSNCYTDVTLKYNGKDVTSLAIFSIEKGFGVIGQWDPINYRYNISGLNNVTEGSITIMAVYQGVSIQKTFSVSTHTNGLSIIHVEIDSSAGNVFINGVISTILRCYVYKGNEDITYNNNYIKTYRWEKINIIDGTIVLEWTPTTVAFESNAIKISASDVSSKAVFQCIVEVEEA